MLSVCAVCWCMKWGCQYKGCVLWVGMVTFILIHSMSCPPPGEVRSASPNLGTSNEVETTTIACTYVTEDQVWIGGGGGGGLEACEIHICALSGVGNVW